ncbi:MAG: NusA N-terminal domain-containing protein, partial [Hyphomonas sp.]
MNTIGVSANRLEILQIAKAVAEEKSIDQRIVVEAMQEAIEKAAKAKYGQEHDIRAKIDPATGEQTLWRIQTVVADADLEDDSKELRLSEAKRIDPELEIGSEL